MEYNCIKCDVPLIIGKNVTQHRIDNYQYVCGKCHLEYNCEYNHRTGRHQSMYENKRCPQFLGIHVAERMLSHIFKNVTRMPINNPGYDLICGKGYMVDVKAACRRRSSRWSDGWLFNIRKNQITDYFLCIAFDSREDLNPEHIWLIPANNINDKRGVGISMTTLDKWSKYELPTDRAISCCNTMKEHTN